MYRMLRMKRPTRIVPDTVQDFNWGPFLIALQNFDPDEPRDDKGKWTEGGGEIEKAADLAGFVTGGIKANTDIPDAIGKMTNANIDFLKSVGVHVYVMKTKDFNAECDRQTGDHKDTVGFYNHRSKNLYVKNGGGSDQVALHELSHALDDIKGKPSQGKEWQVLNSRIDEAIRSGAMHDLNPYYEKPSSGVNLASERWAELASYYMYYKDGRKLNLGYGGRSSRIPEGLLQDIYAHFDKVGMAPR